MPKPRPPLALVLDAAIGVDEAGRGPLAGPVAVAAVRLDLHRPIAGLGDSKALSERRRRELFPRIQDQADAWAIELVTAREIDETNILQATFAGMRRATARICQPHHQARIDGNLVPPGFPCRAQAVVKGDGKIAAIAAASILAKVARDAYMDELEDRYPGYGFLRHKGYGTAAHLQALERLGPCPEHRRSFAPVARCLARGR